MAGREGRCPVLADGAERVEGSGGSGHSDRGGRRLEGLFGGLGDGAFPEVMVQTCIVHLLRHSLSSASYTERAALAEALKRIYRASSEAEAALDAFEDSALGERYPDMVRSWRSAWSRVVPYFAFSAPIWKTIYTTRWVLFPHVCTCQIHLKQPSQVRADRRLHYSLIARSMQRNQ